jgi:hypothetical protein
MESAWVVGLREAEGEMEKEREMETKRGMGNNMSNKEKKACARVKMTKKKKMMCHLPCRHIWVNCGLLIAF